MKKYLLLITLVTLSIAAQCAGKSHKKARKHSSHIGKAHRQHVATNVIAPVIDSSATDANPTDLLNFAQSFIGTPYHFASSNPDYGFDCSGFVGYVFKSFNIPVPRSSCEFVNIGEKQTLTDAKPGDIILFTGTQKHSRRIGHVGIVMSNDDDGVKFIHASSGKEHSVTITTMDAYYKHRFVRVVRVFKQNDDTNQTLASMPAKTTPSVN